MSDPSAPTSAHIPGERLASRYVLRHPIASGGMATVWEATDEVLGRPVAIKILHRHLMWDTTFVSRFRAEAISAAGLTHPGIVSIFDTWSAPGEEAIVMELVQGTTLRHLLDHRGPLAPAEAVTITDHIAAALEAAHAAGIVHRDIKPANILLSADGRVLVTDFGIAKATEGADLTVERTMLGTAKYLAPEQVEGAKVDGRCDLYALGVVIFEMICGRVPFEVDTDTATALARLHQAPPLPSHLRPGLSASLEAVVLRCLARRPEDRPTNAAELRRELAAADKQLHSVPAVSVASGRATETRLEPERTAGTRRPGRWAIRGLVLAGLATVGVLIGALVSSFAAAETIPIASASAFDPLGSPPGEEHNAAAPLAIDHDDTTAWTTESYRDPDALGKPGVGLLLRLDRVAELSEVVISSPSSNWSAVLFVASGDPPTSLEGWGSSISESVRLAPGQARLSLNSARGDSILIWITRTGDNGQVDLVEVEIKGR